MYFRHRCRLALISLSKIRFLRLSAVSGQLPNPGFPDCVQHSLVLLFVLVAYLVGDELLGGSFELAVSNELELNSKFVEKVLEEHYIGSKTEHLH